MPAFTNVATLSYNGNTTSSNVVSGELTEVLSAVKTAVSATYTADDTVTYVISIVNAGSAPFSGLTVTDDLGAYTFGEGTLTPLTYQAGSLLYYVNGVLQPAPAVTAGPPLVISGISVPAEGNAVLVYEASVNQYAPLDATGSIVNTATISGGGLSTEIEVSETVTPDDSIRLTVSKALSPTTVAENGQITYTFVIRNYGSEPADADDDVVLTDTFDPILSDLTVTFNGQPWAEGTNYTYDEATGIFATVTDQITVPAATATQNSDGVWTVTPGVSTLTVTGTV